MFIRKTAKSAINAEAQKKFFLDLKEALSGRTLRVERIRGELVASVSSSNILQVLSFLKEEKLFQFCQLMDVCVVDYLGQEKKRFCVVYHLLSLVKNQRIRLKVPLEEDHPIPSAASIFSCAGWWEREAFDMYGVKFEGHKDLRRILTDYGFEGHPLRKDFPVTGYVQLKYDSKAKKVVEEPVYLEQAYRTFDTLSPWQGMQNAFAEHQKSLQAEEGHYGRS